MVRQVKIPILITIFLFFIIITPILLQNPKEELIPTIISNNTIELKAPVQETNQTTANIILLDFDFNDTQEPNITETTEEPIITFRGGSGGGSSPRPPENNIDNNKVHKLVNKKIEDDNESNVDIIIVVQNESQFQEISDKIKQTGGKVKATYDVGKTISAEIPASKVEEVTKDISVNSTWPNREYSLMLDSSVDLMNIPIPWNLNFTGKGIKIAVLDTGIDENHEMFLNKTILSKEFTNEGDTNDKNGHGTHVAGIALGNGEYKGVAPDASLINAKVLTSKGKGSTETIIAGINWAIDPDNNSETDDGADVIVLSIGAPFNDANSPVIGTLKDAIDMGTTVVISAGNCGETCPSERCKGFVGVTTPGNFKDAITVGAVDDNLEWACFSSGQDFGQYLKPDIVAPGKEITSSFYGNTYETLDGTSMSAPHIAGITALLLEKNNSLNPSEIKQLLENKAIDLGQEGKDIYYGSGFIDAEKLFLEINETQESNETTVINETNQTNKTNKTNQTTDTNIELDFRKVINLNETSFISFNSEDYYDNITLLIENNLSKVAEQTFQGYGFYYNLTDTSTIGTHNIKLTLCNDGCSEFNYTFEVINKTNNTIIIKRRKLGKEDIELIKRLSINLNLNTSINNHETYQAETCQSDDFSIQNNECSDAENLNLDTRYQSKIDHDEDDDWFEFDIPGSGTGIITVNLEVPSNRDYELEVYSPCNNFIDGSYNGEGSDETVSEPIENADKVYVKIYGYSGDYGSEYYYFEASFEEEEEENGYARVYMDIHEPSNYWMSVWIDGTLYDYFEDLAGNTRWVVEPDYELSAGTHEIQIKGLNLVTNEDYNHEISKNIPENTVVEYEFEVDLRDCTSGSCCDSYGYYRPSSWTCNYQYDTEYGCPWGTDLGDDVGRRYKRRYCSGSSSSCSGSTSWDSWQSYRSCDSDERCNPSTYQCDVDPCANKNCGDTCDGNTRKYNGYCSGGTCYYSNTESCTHGCSSGSCITATCGDGTCHQGENCPKDCLVIAGFYELPSSFEEDKNVTVKVIIENIGTVSQTSKVEVGIYSSDFYTQDFTTHGSSEGITGCCEENKYFDTRQVTRGAGERQTTTFYLTTPSKLSVDACDQDPPPNSAWGDSFVIIAGSYSECGSGYDSTTEEQSIDITPICDDDQCTSYHWRTCNEVDTFCCSGDESDGNSDTAYPQYYCEDNFDWSACSNLWGHLEGCEQRDDLYCTQEDGLWMFRECEHGCSGEQCNPDPCTGVTCDDTCDGDTRKYSGSCLSGSCSYLTEDCTHGCSDGQCITPSCGDGTCHPGEDCPKDCLVIVGFFQLQSSVEEDENITINVSIRNDGTVIQTGKVEVGMYASDFYTQDFTGQTSSSHRITGCCENNTYFATKEVTRDPGEQRYSAFNLKAPSKISVDACDQDPPPNSAWGDSFVVIAGAYSACGEDYYSSTGEQSIEVTPICNDNQCTSYFWKTCNEVDTFCCSGDDEDDSEDTAYPQYFCEDNLGWAPCSNLWGHLNACDQRGGLYCTEEDGLWKFRDCPGGCDTTTHECVPLCGDGICEDGETEYNCEDDCYSDIIIETIKNVNPDEAEENQVVTFTAQVKNQGTVTGNIFIEGAVVPESWRDIIYPLEPFSTQTVIDNIIEICPGNKFYDYKIIEELEPGQTEDVEFEVIAPNRSSVNDCDDNTPKASAWDDEFRIIAGTYLHPSGGNYEHFNYATYIVGERECVHPFGTFPECSCLEDAYKCFDNETCNLGNGKCEFNGPCTGLPDGSSENCQCHSDEDCTDHEPDTECRFGQIFNDCIPIEYEDQCNTIDEFKCKDNALYRCEQQEKYKDWMYVTGCTRKQICMADQEACVNIGNYDLVIDDAPPGITLNKQQHTIMGVNVKINGYVDPDTQLEYDETNFELIEGDACLNQNYNQGDNKCYFYVNSLPSKTYLFTFGKDSQRIYTIGQDPVIAYITNKKQLLRRYNDEKAVKLLLTKVYEEAAANYGVVHDLDLQFQHLDEYNNTHPFDIPFSEYSEDRLFPKMNDNSYAQEVTKFIQDQLSFAGNVVLVGDDYVIPHSREIYSIRAGSLPAWLRPWYNTIKSNAKYLYYISGLGPMKQLYDQVSPELSDMTFPDPGKLLPDDIVIKNMYTDQSMVQRNMEYDFSNIDELFRHDEATRGNEVKIILPNTVTSEMRSAIENFKNKLVAEKLVDKKEYFSEIQGSELNCNDFNLFGDWWLFDALDVPIIIGTKETNPALNCYPMYTTGEFEDVISIEPSVWNGDSAAIIFNTNNPKTINGFADEILPNGTYESLHGRGYMLFHDTITAVSIALIPISFGASAGYLGGAAVVKAVLITDLVVSGIDAIDTCYVRRGRLPNGTMEVVECGLTLAPIASYGVGKAVGKIRVAKFMKTVDTMAGSADEIALYRRAATSFTVKSGDAASVLTKVPKAKYPQFIKVIAQNIDSAGKIADDDFIKPFTKVFMKSNIKRAALTNNDELLDAIGSVVKKHASAGDDVLESIAKIASKKGDSSSKLLKIMDKTTETWKKADIEELAKFSDDTLKYADDALEATVKVSDSLDELKHLDDGIVQIKKAYGSIDDFLKQVPDTYDAVQQKKLIKTIGQADNSLPLDDAAKKIKKIEFVDNLPEGIPARLDAEEQIIYVSKNANPKEVLENVINHEFAHNFINQKLPVEVRSQLPLEFEEFLTESVAKKHIAGHVLSDVDNLPYPKVHFETLIDNPAVLPDRTANLLAQAKGHNPGVYKKFMGIIKRKGVKGAAISNLADEYHRASGLLDIADDVAQSSVVDRIIRYTDELLSIFV